MKRSIPAATAVASLAFAAPAMATVAPPETGAGTIGVAYHKDGDCRVNVQGYWHDVKNGIGWQINVDGNAYVERLIKGAAKYRTWGETVNLGASSGKHTIRLTSHTYDGGAVIDFPAVVDCGPPPPPKTITVEKIVDHYIPVPVPTPVKPTCTTFAKTIQVISRGPRGHRGAPITRVDTYIDGTLYDRRTAPASRRVETRRIKVTGLECGKHTFRVTVSRQTSKRHGTTTRRGVLAPGGLNRTVADLGVF